MAAFDEIIKSKREISSRGIKYNNAITVGKEGKIRWALKISLAFSSETSETRGKGGSMGIEENITDRLFLVEICFSFVSFIKSREKSYLCQWDSQRVAGKVARRPKYALIN